MLGAEILPKTAKDLASTPSKLTLSEPKFDVHHPI